MRGVVRLIAGLLRLPPGRSDYTLTEAVRVPMRDGVELLTDVYAPGGESRGTILIRTPYGRSGLVARLTARPYAAHGYTVVNQSCRGTFGSGGEGQPFRAEITDGADTVAWLRRQPWFGGRFALCGASYLGYTAFAVMTDPPPELACAVVATHGTGAFALEPTLGLLDEWPHLDDGMARGTVRLLSQPRRLRPGFAELPLARAQETVLAGSAMPYRAWLTDTDADDPVWASQRLGDALERVGVPVLLHEGWEDRFVDQMLDQYDRLQRRGIDVALTIGPWTHVEAAFQGAGRLMAETLEWLDEHLAGTGDRRRPSPVHIFVTGAGEWRWLPAWPPKTVERALYLAPGGRLDDAPPAPTAAPSSFTFDPAVPTPSVGGRVVNPAVAGRRDNARLEARDDVLVFTGPPLSEPLEVIGEPVVELMHGTDNPYADLFLRLCEVSRRGRSVNLSDAYRRLDPDGPSGTIRLRLDALAHRFPAGSRLRLLVAGGAHPRCARNLGTDEDPATGTRLAPSLRTIAHGAVGFSRLLLPVSS